jgi:SAM-dependent methyltransferase
MIKAIFNVYKYIRFGGGFYRCIICDHRVRIFFPFSHDLQSKAKSNGFLYDFRRMETLNFDQCNCPFCLSSDRERLYMIFLQKYLSNKSFRHSVLDFAPNPPFSNKLKSNSKISYTATDLFRTDVDIKMDICDMQNMEDNRFDIVICSHVLEHVSDPNAALREIKRILAPNGIAILMVPLFWDVKETIENDAHYTESLRLKYYGQSDHVRLFSRHDFIGRIKETGLMVKEWSVSDFEEKLINKNAIAHNSILYICTKQRTSVSSTELT